MSSSRSAIIDKAVDLSREMLARAREKNWEALQQRQAERDALLQRGLAEPIPAELQALASASIAAVKAIDMDILKIIETNKKDVQNSLSKLQSGKKAADFYRQS